MGRGGARTSDHAAEHRHQHGHAEGAEGKRQQPRAPFGRRRRQVRARRVGVRAAWRELAPRRPCIGALEAVDVGESFVIARLCVTPYPGQSPPAASTVPSSASIGLRSGCDPHMNRLALASDPLDAHARRLEGSDRGRSRPGTAVPRPAALPRARPGRRRARRAALGRSPPRLVRRAARRPRTLSAGDDLGHRAAVSSRSTRSRSPSPTAANRRAVARFAAGAERYLNRGLRPLPGYSPYPGDREADTETWFDDNGWWGLAFMNAYRATGTRRWLTDAERALAYVAAARLGSAGRRDLVEHRAPLQGRRGARRGHAAGDADLPADALLLRPRPGGKVPALGQHARASARANGLYAASNLNPTPIDYIESPLIYAQALLCEADGERRRLRTGRAAHGDRAEALRPDPRLLAAVRRDLPAVDARAVLARPQPHPLRARRRQRPRSPGARARTAKGSTCAPGAARPLPTADALPGSLQTQAATTSLFAWLAVYPPPPPS